VYQPHRALGLRAGTARLVLGSQTNTPEGDPAMAARSWIRNLFARPATRTAHKAPHRARLAVEGLEDRLAPATFTVDNVLDDGSTGSLRWAVGHRR
jgi:hypothetical protein